MERTIEVEGQIHDKQEMWPAGIQMTEGAIQEARLLGF